MSRISLPGKMKYKKIILLILVLISAGVLIYEFTNNIKDTRAIIQKLTMMKLSIFQEHRNTKILIKAKSIQQKMKV